MFFFLNGGFCPFLGGKSRFRARDYFFIFVQLFKAHKLLFIHQQPPANRFAVILAKNGILTFFTVLEVLMSIFGKKALIYQDHSEILEKLDKNEEIVSGPKTTPSPQKGAKTTIFKNMHRVSQKCVNL